MKKLVCATVFTLLFVALHLTLYTLHGFGAEKGLVAQWKFDEGKGEEVKDSSGNGFDGEIKGAGWVKGASGNALSFNLENKTAVVVPSDDGLNPKQITVELWFSTGIPQADKQLVNKCGDGKGGYRITVNGNKISWQVPSAEQAWYGMTSTVSFNCNEWVYAVGTYDGKTMRIYINGKESGYKERTGDIVSTSVPLAIGAFNSTGHAGFTGIIDEVRIYNRALTSDEIQKHYEDGIKKVGTVKIVETSKAVETAKTIISSDRSLDLSRKAEKVEKTPSLPKPGMLIEWKFDKDGEIEGWIPNGEMTNVKVSGGMLTGLCTGGDPYMRSPQFEIPANSLQYIEIKMKSNTPGRVEFFWTNTTETKYEGFSPGKQTPFDVAGDNEFHVYQIFPGWQAEKKIILLRFDPFKDCEFAVDYIKIVQIAPGEIKNANFTFDKDAEAWQISEGVDKLTVKNGLLSFKTTSKNPVIQGPALNVNTRENIYVSIQMSVDKGSGGSIFYVTENGTDKISFPVKADGKMHNYNIPMGGTKWQGGLYFLRLIPTNIDGAQVNIDYIKVCPEISGMPEIEIKYFILAGAVNRAGAVNKVSAVINNKGGIARDITAKLILPKKVKLVEGDATQKCVEIDFDEDFKFEWKVKADEPITDTAAILITGANFAEIRKETKVEFTPSLNLPKAEYVPQPKPVKSDYQIGVYYYPGWPSSRNAWDRIRPFPEREPVLGWYREEEVEVADWHFKWCLEHGVSFFIYDWYWNKGSRYLEHSLNALFKSRYGSQIKFCLLWANHNPKGTSSIEDCINVTKFWIDNYFKRDNYLKIDGKPVMVIFSMGRLTEDMGSENVKIAFDKMRDLCKENGFKGLYFVGCSRPDANLIGRMIDEGYDAASAYNWVNIGVEPGQLYGTYEKNIEAFIDYWDRYIKDGRIKFIPPVSGGWDSRPWHGYKNYILWGRTPELFKQHLQSAKKFLDEKEQSPKLKMIFIEAWNEWGEGSYIEPHKEFGFGYLDAIREVFTNAPKEHIDVTPADIGLGPYDVPESTQLKTKTAYEFNENNEGWALLMGMKDVKAEGGALKAISTNNDPAFQSPQLNVKAKKFPFIVLKVKISKNAKAQIFWSTNSVPSMNEPASIRFEIPGDGEFHEIKLNVGENPLWAGSITGLRFDPCSETDVTTEIDYIRFSEK